MAYLVINDTDVSAYVNSLKISTQLNYNAQTNANGDTVVDMINQKSILDIGIIPLSQEAMEAVCPLIGGIANISVIHPMTDSLVNVVCLIPENSFEYYTIQANNIMYKAFTFKAIQL